MPDSHQMDIISFWDLLRSSKRSLRTLCRQLELLSKRDLCRYYVIYNDLMSEVNPHEWEECHPFQTDRCSEDHAVDFAGWVVSQGIEFFESVAKHPECIQQYLEMFGKSELGNGHDDLRWDETVDRAEYRGYQRPDYVASAIYRTYFDGDIHEACYDNRGWPREGLDC